LKIEKEFDKLIDVL